MDEPSQFTNRKQIVPYLPIWALTGNTVVRKWVEAFVDRAGNQADVCKIEYTDKKNKLHEAVAWVKWKHI